MRRVIFNQKGGVGKSTITSNLAAISAAYGLRTLVVDLDPQGNSSQYLLGSAFTECEHTVVDFFAGTLGSGFSFKSRKQVDLIPLQTPFEALHIVPANRELENLQGKLESRYKIYKLRDALQGIADRYDAVFIDTPPALNFFTRSALIAADRCLIPFDCDDFSRRALYELLDNVREIQEDHNERLMVEGIIVNQFQSNANLPRTVVEELINEDLPVLGSYLSASVKVRESHQASEPLIHMAPNHKLTGEYVALYRLLNGEAVEPA
ncbi:MULTISPECIES: ParA family protein [unclassified Ectothiorhodospira]|uniref:ParA family protein n=1 Tax=unclassified Ectothiorhodospira TaxID=2684909 RepID=UPI001EE85C65|nr:MULTISPECIES: ParA family protein [unclassified Ectothiorhodospira]MCG5514628.1 ParA family protein [Ectothiorhodospira sp. 9100]MCG5517998.1 ParA family protein [Ectothiorhodospira sp. 9905]